MKMENMNVEFVEFDAKDVITTSSQGQGGSGVGAMIWLTKTSITNFNAIANDKGDPDRMVTTMISTPLTYYGYTGAYFDKAFHATQTSDDPGEGIYTVSSTEDEAGYSSVLAWLTSHRT